jgi:hypothetical protein
MESVRVVTWYALSLGIVMCAKLSSLKTYTEVIESSIYHCHSTDRHLQHLHNSLVCVDACRPSAGNIAEKTDPTLNVSQPLTSTRQSNLEKLLNVVADVVDALLVGNSSEVPPVPSSTGPTGLDSGGAESESTSKPASHTIYTPFSERRQSHPRPRDRPIRLISSRLVNGIAAFLSPLASTTSSLWKSRRWSLK